MPCGSCEEALVVDALELDELLSFAEGRSFDFSQWMNNMISGEEMPQVRIREWIGEGLRQISGSLKKMSSTIIALMAVMVVMKLLLPADGFARETAAFVCRISCIPSLSSAYMLAFSIAQTLLMTVIRCSELLSPALITAVSLSGAETTASLLSPMTGACAQLIQELLSGLGLPLCTVCAALAAAGSLSSGIRLGKLHQLIRQMFQWGTGVILAAFTGILSLQGRLGSVRDNAASRTARYAIENIIPVIGGKVSDSLDSLLSTAQVVKNALGVSGIGLFVCISIVPLAKILLLVLTLRLMSAISEPLGDEIFTSLTARFSDCIEMLLIICVASVFLCCLLAGSCVSAVSNIMR